MRATDSNCVFKCISQALDTLNAWVGMRKEEEEEEACNSHPALRKYSPSPCLKASNMVSISNIQKVLLNNCFSCS